MTVIQMMDKYIIFLHKNWTLLVLFYESWRKWDSKSCLWLGCYFCVTWPCTPCYSKMIFFFNSCGLISMEFMYLVFFKISLKIWIQKNWPKQQTPVTLQDYVHFSLSSALWPTFSFFMALIHIYLVRSYRHLRHYVCLQLFVIVLLIMAIIITAKLFSKKISNKTMYLSLPFLGKFKTSNCSSSFIVVKLTS